MNPRHDADADGGFEGRMIRALLALVLLLPLAARAAEPTWEERPDWAAEFSARESPGTLLIYDESADCYLVHDSQARRDAVHSGLHVQDLQRTSLASKPAP